MSVFKISMVEGEDFNTFLTKWAGVEKKLMKKGPSDFDDYCNKWIPWLLKNVTHKLLAEYELRKELLGTFRTYHRAKNRTISDKLDDYTKLCKQLPRIRRLVRKNREELRVIRETTAGERYRQSLRILGEEEFNVDMEVMTGAFAIYFLYEPILESLEQWAIQEKINLEQIKKQGRSPEERRDALIHRLLILLYAIQGVKPVTPKFSIVDDFIGKDVKNYGNISETLQRYLFIADGLHAAGIDTSDKNLTHPIKKEFKKIFGDNKNKDQIIKKYRLLNISEYSAKNNM